MHATAKAAANTPNTAVGPPKLSTGGTMRGAMIDPIRPNDAPAPVPVARIEVG